MSAGALYVDVTWMPSQSAVYRLIRLRVQSVVACIYMNMLSERNGSYVSKTCTCM